MAVPFGAIGICTQGSRISTIDFLPRGTPAREPRNELAGRACEQLARYLKHPDFEFDLPLNSVGTPFQRSVWQTIRAIPPGATLTYGEIAKRLNTAPRAVGQACGANPYPVVVPCHRVVASGAELGGFAHSREGWLPGVKRWLLAHERTPGNAGPPRFLSSPSGAGHREKAVRGRSL
jgi:methylated-DNA-[protein]-cysteine S-methyltransferase